MKEYIKRMLFRHRTVKWLLTPLRVPYAFVANWYQRHLYSMWQSRQLELVTPAHDKEMTWISIVVPLYNTAIDYMEEMVHSVVEQTYSHWELILVDDYSTNSEVRSCATRLASQDDRIKTLFLEQNMHISGATNQGVSIATGEYIALLDHDDVLHPQALSWVIHYLQQYPSAKLLYTDEAKLDEKGRLYQPFFKPGWNFEFLRSVNYITHFAVMQRKLYNRLGGEDGNYNGAQDWELFLRMTRACQSKDIIHIPIILYYWRVHSASTAKSLEAKPYLVEAQKKALQQDIAARHLEGKVIFDNYNAQWNIMYHEPNDCSFTIHDTSKPQVRVGELLSEVDSPFIFLITRPTAISEGSARKLCADARRSGVGVVVPYIDDDERVINNLSGIFDKNILSLLLRLNRRSVSKHFYLTSRYNVAQLNAQCAVIETSKLRLINNQTPATTYDISKALSKIGYFSVYNPNVTV